MSTLMTPRGYQEDFDPTWYQDALYCTTEITEEQGDLIPFSAESLHAIFALESINGEKLLDIGTGPTVHSVISASRHVSEIHLSDFTDSNRVVLQQWLEGAPNVPALFKYYVAKENDGTTWEARANEVRDKVKKIYAIDLHLPDPIKELDCKYDVITSSLCLEVAARSREEHSNMVAKVAGMLKPGGYLVMVGMLGQGGFRVGKFRFDGLKIDGEYLKTVITNVGLQLKVWRESKREDDTPYCKTTDFTDFTGLFAMAAQKI